MAQNKYRVGMKGKFLATLATVPVEVLAVSGRFNILTCRVTRRYVHPHNRTIVWRSGSVVRLLPQEFISEDEAMDALNGGGDNDPAQHAS